MRYLLVLLAILSMTCSVLAPAKAGSTSDAQELYLSGLNKYNSGDVSGALADWAQVLNTKPDSEATQSDGSWKVLGKWSGSATKTTETFHVTAKQWLVTWNAQKDGSAGPDDPFMLCIVYFAPDGKNGGIVTAVYDPGIDSSYVHESGDFYLQIGAAGCRYAVAVWEKQ